MGTRADFYIGSGDEAVWLGSVGWDGYKWDQDHECKLMQAKTDDEFKSAVDEISKERDDFTHPDNGWPWPWDDSHTTDYAYCLIDGKVIAYIFGSEAFINEDGERDSDESKKAKFPNMKNRKNVSFDNRSGVIFIG